MGTLSYTYDAAGHVASIASSNAGGASMSYTYDALNRLSTVVNNRLSSGSNTTTYTYDEANNVATVTYPNGVVSQLAYDAVNHLASLASAPGSYTYQRNPNGSLASASESNGRQVSCSYDGINRLTSETVALDPWKHNGEAAYSLDPVGNRLAADSSLSGIASSSATFNADDQLSGGSYDQNGNVTAMSGKTFAYDSQNQLVSMNGGAVSLLYDAFGNRLAKTANGVTTQYLVEDDKNPTGYPQVFDELTNGVVSRTYTYGLQRVSESQTINTAWTTSYYGYDGSGSVRNLTDATGAVTDTYEYDAFGNALTTSGSTPNAYLYRGEQYDSDLGLYYLCTRYYNPATGRFMSRDPEEGKLRIPSSLHRYLYAQADPVNGIDPFGREDLVEYHPLEAGEGPTMRAEAEAVEGEFEKAAGELCSLCFASGTPIHTDHGEVAIENLKVGDQVEAVDASTGRREVEPITALVPPHHDQLLEIRVEGERDPLRPSKHHPFWARRGDHPAQWIDSGALRIGDRLRIMAGNWRAVTAIASVAGQATVYNFTVAKDHDYFVGRTGFLVHNIDCGCNPVFDPNDLHPDTVTPGNPNGLYPIEPTGSYSGDRQALLDSAGMENPGGGWVAHYQSFNPDTGEMIMQLVDRTVHQFFTHRGGVKDCGIPYVP